MEEQAQTQPAPSPAPSTSPISVRQTSKPLIIIITLIFLLMAGGLVYLAYQNYQLQRKLNQLLEQQTNLPQGNSTPATSMDTSVNSEILSSFLRYIEAKDFYTRADTRFNTINENSMWWVSDDNWSILIKDIPSTGLVRAKAYKELSEKDSFTLRLVNEVNNFFDNKGFSKSIRNSSKSVSDDSFYDYILGYQKDDERCLLTVNPDESYYKGENGEMIASPNIVLDCSRGEFQQSYDEQIPFLKAMNDRTAVVRIEKMSDVAAYVLVNWRRTGSFALFSKVNGYWEMIYRGQDQPSCSTLQKYSFPAEIYSDCY